MSNGMGVEKVRKDDTARTFVNCENKKGGDRWQVIIIILLLLLLLLLLHYRNEMQASDSLKERILYIFIFIEILT